MQISSIIKRFIKLGRWRARWLHQRYGNESLLNKLQVGYDVAN